MPIQLTLQDIPFERIVETDLLAMMANPQINPIRDGRIVSLACGHKLLTKALRKARCPRCLEMLQRSITDGSEDYDAFRNHGKRDRMVWPDDPFRMLHEPDYAHECYVAEVIQERDAGRLSQAAASRQLIALDKKHARNL